MYINDVSVDRIEITSANEAKPRIKRRKSPLPRVRACGWCDVRSGTSDEGVLPGINVQRKMGLTPPKMARRNCPKRAFVEATPHTVRSQIMRQGARQQRVRPQHTKHTTCPLCRTSVSLLHNKAPTTLLETKAVLKSHRKRNTVTTQLHHRYCLARAEFIPQTKKPANPVTTKLAYL